MQSMFPQFGATSGAAANRNVLVSFSAGKMEVEERGNSKVFLTPNLKKGRCQLIRGDDGVLHFQWLNRASNEIEEDILLPNQSEEDRKKRTNRKLSQLDDKRVYLLELKEEKKKLFFWMQRKDAKDDAATVAKFNKALNTNSSPSANTATSTAHSSGNTAGGAGGQVDQQALMQILSSMGANGGAGGQVNVSELQNILQHMSVPTTTPSAAPAAAGGPPTSRSATAETNANTGGDDVVMAENDDDDDELDEEELLQRAIAESMQENNDTPPNNSGETPIDKNGAVEAASGAISTQDLQRAMAMFQQRPTPISLQKIIHPDNMTDILSDQKALAELVDLLPDDLQTKDEFLNSLRSPQLRQSIGSLCHALQTNNFNGIMQNFGLDPSAANEKLTQGDAVGAFLDAIEDWGKKNPRA